MSLRYALQQPEIAVQHGTSYPTHSAYAPSRSDQIYWIASPTQVPRTRSYREDRAAHMEG